MNNQGPNKAGKLGPGFIYCITNKVNGKRYVGETMYPWERWDQHQRSVRWVNKKTKAPLRDALVKYGVSNFTFDIVQVFVTAEEALQHENDWIERLRSRLHQHGYNCKEGGRGGKNPGQSTRDKLSAAGKGRKASKTTKERLSHAHSQVWAERRAPFRESVRQLHAQGLNNCEIADTLGANQATVSRTILGMGLESNVWSTEGMARRNAKVLPKISGENHYKANRISDIAPKILEMRSIGKGYDEICEALSTSPVTVLKVLKEAGMKGQHTKVRTDKGIQTSLTEDRKVKIIICTWLRSLDFSCSDIGTMLGLEKWQVSKYSRVVLDTPE